MHYGIDFDVILLWTNRHTYHRLACWWRVLLVSASLNMTNTTSMWISGISPSPFFIHQAPCKGKCPPYFILWSPRTVTDPRHSTWSWEKDWLGSFSFKNCVLLHGKVCWLRTIQNTCILGLNYKSISTAPTYPLHYWSDLFLFFGFLLFSIRSRALPACPPSPINYSP